MNLKIGFSEIDITPQKKLSLFGQFSERISEYVEKPLTATAMAIESSGEQLIIVSCDLTATNWFLTCAIRDELKDNILGLDVNKIILCATHTHTAYAYGGGTKTEDGKESFTEVLQVTLEKFLRPGQKYIQNVNVTSNPEVSTTEENFDFLKERLSKVISDAWKNRKSAGFVNAFGRAPVGMCRRSAYNDGTAQMWGDTNTAVFTELEGGSDSGIELLYVFDENKNLMGIVPNLACPAQCVQHRHFVSPDFWGEVKMRLRACFGEDIYMLPLCSVAGDQCPVDLVRWVEPESDINDPNCVRVNPPKRKADPSMFDIAGMVKAGKRIANEIIDLWNEGLDDIIYDAPFEHRIVNMALPLRRVTLTDVKNAEKGIKEYIEAVDGDVDYNDVAMLQVHLGTITRFKIQETTDIMDTEVHIVRLGNIAIATNPFEPFLSYGNQIKARSDAEQTFLVQLANGAEGYIPTERAEKNGHYSAFVSSGQIGYIGGEQLVRETLQNIRDMFEK